MSQDKKHKEKQIRNIFEMKESHDRKKTKEINEEKQDLKKSII